jgi:hypothetical protein
MAGLQVGTVLPPIAVVDSSGRRDFISFDEGEPTVLYVMASSCGWCWRNYPNITALSSALRGYRFVGLALDNDWVTLSKHLEENPFPFPVFVADASVPKDELGFTVTPQTAVVDIGGRVSRMWQGALIGSRAEEVERLFSVKLPGLREAPVPVQSSQ